MATKPVHPAAVKVVNRATSSEGRGEAEGPTRTKSGIMVRQRPEGVVDDRPPVSVGTRNAALLPLIDAMLSEIDTAHNPARRLVDRVPEVSVVLTNGAELRGTPLDYSNWQRILMLRTTESEALHVPVIAIVSVTVHLSPENAAAIARR